MLSSIIKSNMNALSDVFIGKEFRRSANGDKEKHKNYLVNLVSAGLSYPSDVVTLSKEIIPDDVTLYALAFTHKKDPSISPILLKYFTHKNLLKEAKDDLDEINQELQDVMDGDLEDLQDKKTKLQRDKTNLVQVYSKEAKTSAIYKVDKQITATSSEIKKIKLLKEDIKNLLNGEKATISPYPPKYGNMLGSKLTKVLEEELTAYAENNKTNIEKTYQSINSKAKKITILQDVIAGMLMLSPAVISGIFLLSMFFISGPKPSYPYRLTGYSHSLNSTTLIVTLFSLIAISYAIVGIVYLVNKHYKQSFVKEMENFIEEPRHMDKATSTENVEESKQQEKEQEVRDLIDFSDSSYASQVVTPSAPPLEEEVKGLLYPNLEKCFPQYSAAKEVESRSQGW